MAVEQYIYIIVPIVVVVVVLKLCLIFCRAYIYHRRREEQRALVIRQQQMLAAARAQAAREGVLRITTTGQGNSHQIVRVHHPVACAGGRVVPITRPTGSSAPRRTLILQCNPDTLMAVRRSIDPNMPPSYDQAVSGRDRSVKVEDDSGTADLPPPPEYSPQVAPATAPTPPAEDEERIPAGTNEEVQPLLP